MNYYFVKTKFTFRNLNGHRTLREVSNLVEASSKEKIEEIVSKHIIGRYQPYSTDFIEIKNVEVFETLSEKDTQHQNCEER